MQTTSTATATTPARKVRSSTFTAHTFELARMYDLGQDDFDYLWDLVVHWRSELAEVMNSEYCNG